ncbi:MAG: hypothetical protein ACYTGR_12830 [Planctomycetota bacterium]|jgi:hypothetical protein
MMKADTIRDVAARLAQSAADAVSITDTGFTVRHWALALKAAHSIALHQLRCGHEEGTARRAAAAAARRAISLRGTSPTRG